MESLPVQGYATPLNPYCHTFKKRIVAALYTTNYKEAIISIYTVCVLPSQNCNMRQLTPTARGLANIEHAYHTFQVMDPMQSRSKWSGQAGPVSLENDPLINDFLIIFAHAFPYPIPLFTSHNGCTGFFQPANGPAPSRVFGTKSRYKNCNVLLRPFKTQ